jgi:hypothetical protein
LLISLLFGLFFTLVYESGLVLQLFLDKPVSVYRTVRDIKNCHVDARKICMAGGGNTEDFWRAAIEPARASCRKVELANDQPVLIRGRDPFERGLDMTANTDACEFFMGSSGTLAVAAETVHCGKLSVVGEPFYTISSGFALPKGSNLTEIMSEETLKLQLQDKIPSVLEFGTDNIKCTPVRDTQVTWRRLKVFFYVAYPVLAMLLLVVVFDQIQRHQARRAAKTDGAEEGQRADEGDVEEGAVPTSTSPSAAATAPGAPAAAAAGR